MAPLIGYHTSSAGGYFNAAKKAYQLGLETFQLFLGSPRTWRYRDIKEGEVEKFLALVEQYNYERVTVHLNYLPNPSTPHSDTELRDKTRQAFIEEIRRAELIGASYLVFHLGSHKGKGFESAKPMVADLLNEVIDPSTNVKLLLETSAGQKNSVGSTFGEVAEILDLIDHPDKVGVCFDTCHVFAAGYDLRTTDTVEQTLSEFDDSIGLDRLDVVHANDSKGGIGEGKDRHANIGTGNIGVNGFKALINHDALDNKPFILETPSKHMVKDIELLKSIRE